MLEVDGRASGALVLRSLGAAVTDELHSGMPDTDMQGWPTPQERQEYLEEINSELAVLFSILYFMTEIFRGDDTWADDMSAPFLVCCVSDMLKRAQ